VPGSPFPTGGTGVQDTSLGVGPYESDQDIVIDKSRNLLFAVNSGSDTIAVFHINHNGSLVAVEGSPFPSGGTNPVSLAVKDDILFVVNKNGDGPRVSNTFPNYSTFRILRNGAISKEPISTVGVALGSSPTQAFLVPGTNLMFGADLFGGLLQSFQFDEDGHLHQNRALPLATSDFDNNAPPLPDGLWTHPRLPLLYVGYVAANRVGVYRYNEDGHLRFIRTVSNNGVAICWVRINKAGTRMYTSNTVSASGDTSTMSVYDLTDADNPVEIQTPQLIGQGNVRQFELSPDGKFIYAITGRFSTKIPFGQGNALHIFKIEGDGTLTEQTPVQIPVPAGVLSQGVAVLER
jgi:6-phosphogluconolactonase (cycloisomerase 2 family)